MIIIRSGFKIDQNASTYDEIVVTTGSLYDDNRNIVYNVLQQSFPKPKTPSSWIYYDVERKIFITQESEISIVDLDSSKQNYCPLAYIEMDARGIITLLIPLDYKDFNLPPAGSGSSTDLSSLYAVKNIQFMTEKNITVENKIVRTSKNIFQVLNLFIYDQGDVILGTLEYRDNVITLAEDVSPAVCEVTYAYIEN